MTWSASGGNKLINVLFNWLITIDKARYDPFGWCATEIDNDGNYVAWDYCKTNCESMKRSAIIYQFDNNRFIFSKRSMVHNVYGPKFSRTL